MHLSLTIRYLMKFLMLCMAMLGRKNEKVNKMIQGHLRVMVVTVMVHMAAREIYPARLARPLPEVLPRQENRRKLYNGRKTRHKTLRQKILSRQEISPRAQIMVMTPQTLLGWRDQQLLR